jgi:hypothetical protein
MNAAKRLERAAMRAHTRGACWAEFWEAYGHQVKAAEPYHAGRYHRLVNRLLSLVASGDTANVEPIGEPWLLDDDLPEAISPHDTATVAKCQLSFCQQPITE